LGIDGEVYLPCRSLHFLHFYLIIFQKIPLCQKKKHLPFSYSAPLKPLCISCKLHYSSRKLQAASLLLQGISIVPFSYSAPLKPRPASLQDRRFAICA
jgi:hypothetical protein